MKLEYARTTCKKKPVSGRRWVIILALAATCVAAYFLIPHSVGDPKIDFAKAINGLEGPLNRVIIEGRGRRIVVTDRATLEALNRVMCQPAADGTLSQLKGPAKFSLAFESGKEIEFNVHFNQSPEYLYFLSRESLGPEFYLRINDADGRQLYDIIRSAYELPMSP